MLPLLLGTRRLVGAVALSFLIAAPACSSSRDEPLHADDDGGVDGGIEDASSTPTAEWVDACDRYGQAACAFVDRCPTQLLPDSWSQDCVAIISARCLQESQLPGVNPDPGETLARAEIVDASECTTDPTFGPYVGAHGSLEVGAACAKSSQCETEVCAVERGCGRCLEVGGEDQDVGEACDVVDGRFFNCREGLGCLVQTETEQGTCFKPPVESDACAPEGCFDPHLECVQDECVRASSLDEACSPDRDTCSSYRGLVCDAERLVCRLSREDSQVAIGESCGGMNSVGYCGPDANCVLPEGVDPGFYDGPGTCTAIPRLHGACARTEECGLGMTCEQSHCEIAAIPARPEQCL